MIMLRFAVQDLWHDWGRSQLTISTLAAVVVAFLILSALSQAFRDYGDTTQGQFTNLMVKSSDALDPIESSLRTDVLKAVKEAGGPDVERIAAMIFRRMRIEERVMQVRAVTQEDMEIVNQLSLVYNKVENFRLVSGHALGSGELPRNAMIGYRLAENKKLGSEKKISLRGRDFNVIGIFRTDTYTDNEAWISLEDAQALLGWGTDVSVYIIPHGGFIKEGDNVADGVTAARRGESGQALSSQYKPVLDVHGTVAQAMGLVTALTLINSAGWLALLILAGTFLPVWVMNRLKLAQLLRVE